MRVLRLAIIALSMIAAATATASSAAVAARPDDVAIPYRSFTLPNGLTAIVYSDHSVPSVYVSVRYRIGSGDEPAGRFGFAHLFEHLMFESTAHRKENFVAAMRKIGASGVNGMTGTDWTTYFETVPANALDSALWLESDRMGYLAGGISQEVLDRQRAVVKNEKDQGDIGPERGANERFLANYYPAGHPYAHATIGSVDDLDHATLADVKNWFDDNYGASNAVIVLAGDVDFATARTKIERYFGDVRPGTRRDRLSQWVPTFTTIKRDTLYADVPVTVMSRTWPLANDDPHAGTLLRLAAITLAQRHDASLRKALVGDGKIALEVDARVTENRLDSLFSLSVMVRPGVSQADADRAIDAALADYVRRGPDPSALGATVGANETALLRSLQGNAAMGAWLIDGYMAHDDALFFMKQRRWAAEATAGTVRDAAKAVLETPYYASTMISAPPVESATATVDRSAMPLPARATATLRFPPISSGALPNGLKVVVATRSRLPLVDAELVFDTGSLAESGYASGAADRAIRLIAAGTSKRDGPALRDAFARLNASIEASASERQSRIGWQATTTAFEPSLALVAEMIRYPSYPQSAVNDNPTTGGYSGTPASAAALFARAMRGDVGTQTQRTAGADPAIAGRDAIARFHDHEIGPNNATLYLVGDIDLKKATAFAIKYFGDWRPVKPSPLATPLSRATPMPRIILVDAPGAPQSIITTGAYIPPFAKDNAAAETLANAALGGSAESRLYVDLRDRKGWTYGLSSALSNDTVGPRMFTATGSVKAANTAQSIAAIRENIAAFVSTAPMSQEELDREKANAIQAFPLAFGGNATVLDAMTDAAALGLPHDHGAGTMQRLAEVTLDDVRRVAAADFKPADLTWLVIGDLRLIEKDVRALGIGPVEIWDTGGARLR